MEYLSHTRSLTWLTNDELSLLKCLHADFYADGVSAMDTTSGILIGRPFGGIGILWRKSIGACIQVHKYNNRVMGIEFDNGSRKLLAVNIYMPYDNRSRQVQRKLRQIYGLFGDGAFYYPRE